MEILAQSTQTPSRQPYTHLGYVAASNRGSFWIPLIPAIFLFVIGVRQLKRQKKRYRIASGAAIICSLFLFAMAIAFLVSKPGIYQYRRVLSGINLKQFSAAFAIYAYENEGALIPSEKWCDVLIAQLDVPPKAFSVSNFKAEEGECIYAMNQNVVGMKLDEIPGDVVLLFETSLGVEDERTGSLLSRPFAVELGYMKDKKIYTNRWNQVGGPGDIKTDYHETPGACVLFVDGHTAFVEVEDIPRLKWTVEDSSLPGETELVTPKE